MTLKQQIDHILFVFCQSFEPVDSASAKIEALLDDAHNVGYQHGWEDARAQSKDDIQKALEHQRDNDRAWNLENTRNEMGK